MHGSQSQLNRFLTMRVQNTFKTVQSLFFFWGGDIIQCMHMTTCVRKGDRTSSHSQDKKK